MNDIAIAPIDIVFSRARPLRSALHPDLANANPSAAAILHLLRQAFGCPRPAAAQPWTEPRLSEAWRVATNEISRHQDDAHFRASLDAATLAMGMALGVDKAHMPLALLACALICPDSAARSGRVRLVLAQRDLWVAYPQSELPAARAFREAALSQLAGPLLRTSASFGCEGDLLSSAATLLAGAQDAPAWARIGSAAGASMMGASAGAPWSRVPSAALLGLPAPFWIAAQRRLSATTTCWRLIDQAMRQRASSEPGLELAIRASALVAFSPAEAERCERDYPRWPQEERLAEAATHLATAPHARQDLAARVHSASSRASTHAMGAVHGRRGSGGDLHRWTQALSVSDIHDLFREFEMGCQIQLVEHDAMLARRHAFFSQQPAPDAFIPGSLAEPAATAPPEEHTRRVVPWPRNPDTALSPPGGWRAVVESLASASTMPWPGASFIPAAPPVLAPAASSHRPASPFDVAPAAPTPPLLPIGAGRWLHVDRVDAQQELRLSELAALAEFSRHARAQAYAMKGRPARAPQNRAFPGAR